MKEYKIIYTDEFRMENKQKFEELEFTLNQYAQQGYTVSKFVSNNDYSHKASYVILLEREI